MSIYIFLKWSSKRHTWLRPHASPRKLSNTSKTYLSSFSYFAPMSNIKFDCNLDCSSPHGLALRIANHELLLTTCSSHCSSGVQLGAEVASVSGKMCGATQLDWNPSDPKQVADPPRCLALCLTLPRPLHHSAWLSHCLALYLALILLAPCLALTSRYRVCITGHVPQHWPLMVSSLRVLITLSSLVT